MCKHSNVFSRPVLIARGLDSELQCRSAVFRSVSVCRHEDLRARKGAGFSAVIAEGSHLFPFRTEQLSPPAPMVLQGQPCGRVGRRRIIVTKARELQSSRAFVVVRDSAHVGGHAQLMGVSAPGVLGRGPLPSAGRPPQVIVSLLVPPAAGRRQGGRRRRRPTALRRLFRRCLRPGSPRSGGCSGPASRR